MDDTQTQRQAFWQLVLLSSYTVCAFVHVCACVLVRMRAAGLKALCFYTLIHYFQESGPELSQHRYGLVTIKHTH